MLRPRIIPCLLIKDGGLVKTVNFNNPKYVGDPINVVKILNEKEVDELIVLDISSTTSGQLLNYQLIENIAAECRMPLCYGGGISNVEQIKRLISLGVEKVSVSSAIFNNDEFLIEASKIVGNQSIAVVLDVKYINNDYFIFINNGVKNTEIKLFNFINQLSKIGIGELVINSIDRDGTMLGYDFELVEKVKSLINFPLSVIGGASSHENITELFKKFGQIGAGVGSLFVFKGKYKAVLVNYPTGIEKLQILNF
jgi:cyclase